MSDEVVDDQPPCPTCGERGSEDIGQDVRRCDNCTYVWIPGVAG